MRRRAGRRPKMVLNWDAKSVCGSRKKPRRSSSNMGMTNSKNLVLITRPAADADAFANDVTSLGFTPLIEPMLGIVPVPHETPDLKSYPAIVFTSANAVRVFGCKADNRDVLVFAVGSHTADEARKAGYLRIISAEGDGA